jgi:hypothetical protein
MTNKVPDILAQSELDVMHISDVQMLLNDKSKILKVTNQFEHKGVLLLEIENRETTKTQRFLVLRQSLAQVGRVVLMRLSSAGVKGKAVTTHGLDLHTAGGISETHWCSGLAIKRALMDDDTESLAKRKVFDCREDLCKALLQIIRNDEVWDRQKWKDVRVSFAILVWYQQILTCYAGRTRRHTISSRSQEESDQITKQGHDQVTKQDHAQDNSDHHRQHSQEKGIGRRTQQGEPRQRSRDRCVRL